MRTWELLIVFAALMAMLSVVAIAIDWAGNPLRGRRFIARMFRYDDEIGRAPAAVPGRNRAARPMVAAPTFTPLPAGAAATATAVAPNDRESVWETMLATPSTGEHQIAGRSDNGAQVLSEWLPGMALDQPVSGRPPSATIKAERFWRAASESPSSVTLGKANAQRMQQGKPPRRLNPRTGRPESLQLAGLREASMAADVRMHWPDDSVDPWAES